MEEIENIWENESTLIFTSKCTHVLAFYLQYFLWRKWLKHTSELLMKFEVQRFSFLFIPCNLHDVASDLSITYIMFTVSICQWIVTQWPTLVSCNLDLWTISPYIVYTTAFVVKLQEKPWCPSQHRLPGNTATKGKSGWRNGSKFQVLYGTLSAAVLSVSLLSV